MVRTGKDNKNEKQSGGRNERLAAALRENLRRRKAQERGRVSPAAGSPKDKNRVPENDRNDWEFKGSDFRRNCAAKVLSCRQNGSYAAATSGRGEHGSYTYRRWTAPERDNPDFGRQERDSPADDRESADAGDVDP